MDSLYQRYECQIFSQSVLERGLQRLLTVGSELNVDFAREYERLKELISEKQHLKQFVYGNPSQASNAQLAPEMEALLGTFEDAEELQQIIEAVRLTELEP